MLTQNIHYVLSEFDRNKLGKKFGRYKAKDLQKKLVFYNIKKRTFFSEWVVKGIVRGLRNLFLIQSLSKSLEPFLNKL